MQLLSPEGTTQVGYCQGTMAIESDGRYQVIERIGQGGMATVHRAYDQVLERTVALKVLHPHLAEREDSRARFSREAKAVARLKHPNILEIFDYAALDSEHSYIVTEFVDGPTLRQLADSVTIEHAEVAVLLMLPVVDALAKAHFAGIIHRDVKPENIMIRRDGSPVLMDFGIAQMIDMETLTATGTMLGSPAHMAPEVIDGTDIGAPSDIFSVGTSLYWLVTGALPFSGPNPSALFRRILETHFDPVLDRRPRAGRRLARIVESCLTRSPEQRPTAAHLCSSLTDVLSDMGMTQLAEERRQFIYDTGMYQNTLGTRLVPQLVRQAEGAHGNRQTATAVDHLDRALELEPDNPDARALLKRVERDQNAHQRLRFMAILACAILPVAFGLWFHWSSPDRDAPEPPLLNANLSAPKVIQSQSQSAMDALASEALTPSDASLAMTEDPMDAGIIRVVSDATIPDAGGPQDSAAVRDVLVPDAAPRPRSVNRRARRDARRRSSGSTGTQQSTTEQMRPVKRVVKNVAIKSIAGAAKVYINGKLHPKQYLANVRGSGINLTVGTHKVEFKLDGCQPDIRTHRVQANSKSGGTLIYKCVPQDATLFVKTRTPNLSIFSSPQRQFIGRTNTSIYLKIPRNEGALRLERDMKLTIRTPSGNFKEIAVKLQAGKQTTVQLDI